MQNLDQILSELYELDPSLKSREADIKKIISELSRNQPNVVLDSKFVAALREKIAGKAMQPKTSWLDIFKNKTTLSLAGIAVVVLILVSHWAGQKNPLAPITALPGQNNGEKAKTTEEFALLPAEKQVEQAKSVIAFSSREDFIKYLENSQSQQNFAYGLGGSTANLSAPMAEDSFSKSAPSTLASPQGTSAERYSQTNSQIAGIDEPDIVKTDGKNLFMSLEQPYYYYERPMRMDEDVAQPSENSSMKIAPPYHPPAQESQILRAFPAGELKKLGEIDKQGNLLLTDGVLAIFTYQGIYGYDVKNPGEPKQLWYLKYENNSQLSAARLKDGKIYFVTQNYINYSDPCPVRPLSVNGTMVEISCPQIYHPIAPVTDSATYNVFSLNPKNGEIQNKFSFIGSSYASTVYMSDDNLYLTYVVQPNILSLMADFLKTKGMGILPDEITNRLAKLQSYDISQAAKMTEMSQVLEKYYQGLNEDERLKKENDISNRMGEYVRENARKLSGTGIAKIAIKDLSLKATGQIPGTLLNQFALDEYQGNLRAAATINGKGFWWGWGFSGTSNQSMNDVYVLNDKLETVGSIKDLGKGEQIYSARFIEDKGYLVTFKQTDPFYVLDLKDAKNPKTAGELKIPGFSSYLHPLEKNVILGVGQENGQVKLSLFDVSNPNDPKESDKYQLKEYWSEVANNHHAFLQDSRHKIFFLPAGQNGYVFSYDGGKLNMKKAIASTSAKRAIYINDTLYVISQDKISAFDENSWEKTKELGL